ncbi:hypothetical protein CSIM01_04096 [Colletotrichum simmondsii]|uniref:DUF6604 domain-containing protein n=1 Tax=Colletotrichum simmondsii TaxID=703756 RepID=A0A135S700_9PEZI|nr:hypothetical protein CSIM01_04096 [Colletotrichum simmondsii]
MQTIPPATFRLFRSVINARTEHLAFLQRIVSEEDPQYGKDIKIHETFVQLVTEAFVALGGNSWIDTEQSRGVQGRSNTRNLTPEKLADFINFSALDLKSLSLESSGESSTDTVPVPLRGSQRRAQAKSGRGGKGKKKAKKAPGALLNQVPIEQYSIVEADGTGEAESFMAACAIAKEHRTDTELEVFGECPELQSYETFVAAIIRGNLETAQGSFIKALAKLSPGGQHGGTKTTSIDLKEYIQLGTFRDFVDFLEDYQQSEDGKPTAKMLNKIKDWDPTLDLQHTTKRERLKWRRSYTINWLYDLVNSYTALQRRDGEWVRLENLPNCPLAGSEPLLGLQDFACFVTSLLMKKPGTDVLQDIMPHRVFQLQCIVDAFTISCGWTNTTRRGHVLGPRSPNTLGPMRDIDGFLGRRTIGNSNQESSGKGKGKGKGKGGTKLYIGDIELSVGGSTKDDSNFQNDDKNLGVSNGVLRSANLMAHFYGAELRNAHRQPMMDFVSVFCKEFDFLGQSVPMTGDILPTSRFDHTGPNGMWRYSPYLCGVGVMEGLERVYRTSMLTWDSLEEPTAMIHLHNMLVQQGHIKQPLAYYQVLQDMFRDSFFPDGQVPRSNFAEAFLGIGELLWGDGRAKPKPALPKSAGYHRSIDVSTNVAFNTKSHLLVYREANWHIEWIPDKELNPRTSLALLRASRLIAKTPLNSMTKDEKSLVNRVKKALGVEDEELLSRGNALLKKLGKTRPHQSSTGRNGTPIEVVSGDRVRPSRVQLLDLIKGDLYNDICGNRSYSTFNYILLYVNMIETFEKIEYELARAQDSDCESILGLGTRLHMVDALMRKERERKSLKVVAKVLESQRELPYRYPRNQKPVETCCEGDDALDYDGNEILCSVM